ncbi:MAG: HD domain-containing phosphohydrolase [Smithella sp.]|jgi:HD-GYP domain-containing protein (c-di-GMP phosphodiesterase class II)
MVDQQSDSRGEALQSFYAKQLLLDTAKITLQQLSGLLKNVNIYPESHPFLLSVVEKLMVTIEGLLVDRKEIAFYFVSGELFFETNPMPIDQSITTLVEQFTSRDIGGIIFKPGITIEEFVRLAVLMNRDPSALTADGGIINIISRENISHINLHSVLLVDKKSGGSAAKEEKRKAAKLFLEAIVALKEMVKNIHSNKTVNMRRINTVVQNMVDNILANRDTLIALTNLKMHDEYTFAHCVNTSIFAISLAIRLFPEKSQIAALGVSAMLHDIGKVRIHPDITNKTSDLTDEESEALKRHPIEGALILSDIQAITKIAMVTAFEHHQHGGVDGYPQIDGHVQQHPFSQIISIADAYEVLTARRVYYNGEMSPDQVISLLAKKRESDFNAVLVKAFINMIGIFPIGSLLNLSNGEVGLVVHQTSDLMRPRVLLLTKFDGSEKESGEEISLLETIDGKYKRDVVGTINPYTANIDMKQYLE